MSCLGGVGQCLGFTLQTSSDYVQELVAEDEEVLLLERLEPAIVEAINDGIRSRDVKGRDPSQITKVMCVLPWKSLKAFRIRLVPNQELRS